MKSLALNIQMEKKKKKKKKIEARIKKQNVQNRSQGTEGKGTKQDPKKKKGHFINTNASFWKDRQALLPVLQCTAKPPCERGSRSENK